MVLSIQPAGLERQNIENDWTLDTNVIIRANGGVITPRQLINCIGKTAYLCWSSSVAQEYQARGAVILSRYYPPVPVQNANGPIWFHEWLRRPEITSRIVMPRITKLTGSEKDDLRRGQFRDPGDFCFLELARSSHSHRLVTQEEDYNKRSIASIQRILGVRCLNYDNALQECQH